MISIILKRGITYERLYLPYQVNQQTFWRATKIIQKVHTTNASVKFAESYVRTEDINEIHRLYFKFLSFIERWFVIIWLLFYSNSIANEGWRPPVLVIQP